MAQQFSIALLIETSSIYGRQILRGIQRFITTDDRSDWIAVIEERDLYAGTPDWITHWSGDGIISRQMTVDLAHELAARNIPFVELNDRRPLTDCTSIRSDDEEIGRMAAEHLHERGLKHFAFSGFGDEDWSNRRFEGFRKYVEALDDAQLYCLQSDWYARDVKRWNQEKQEITQWLQTLPKPVGIMACNDIRGKQLIDCCHYSGIDVPESIAVIGVDNDELLCSFCRTPLTSVMPNAEAIGYRSAALLAEKLLTPDAPQPPQEIRVPPLGVIARRSSDIVAVDDEELAAALKYIRHHACQGISVTDVIRATGMSRSTIERKMRQVINRSPQQEIRRVQLRQVCTLLAGTELPIEAIATQCGYDHPEYLHVVFKREMKMTPGEYRNAADS